MLTRIRPPSRGEAPTSSKDRGDLATGRFAFGRNWRRFLRVLTSERIAIAEASLQAALGTGDLTGRTFLDVGSGSGLFSLCARRMGAAVVSFDHDPEAVACTLELRARHFPDDAGWTVRQGAILDDRFVRSLGTFDVVYAWGVLHHTGDMWTALDNTAALVNTGGQRGGQEVSSIWRFTTTGDGDPRSGCGSSAATVPGHSAGPSCCASSCRTVSPGPC